MNKKKQFMYSIAKSFLLIGHFVSPLLVLLDVLEIMDTKLVLGGIWFWLAVLIIVCWSISGEKSSNWPADLIDDIFFKKDRKASVKLGFYLLFILNVICVLYWIVKVDSIGQLIFN